MARAIVLVLLCVCVSIRADFAGSPSQVPSTVTVPGNYTDPFAQRKILGVDPNYLDGKTENGPESKNSNTGQTRYPDNSNEEYNTAQREEWMRNCAEERKQDSKAFRDCFERQKQKALKDLRERFDAVEKRQAQPLRSAPNPLLDDVQRAPKEED